MPIISVGRALRAVINVIFQCGLKMYEEFWGLSSSPFRNAVDDRRFHPSPVHEEALARLYYVIEQGRVCGVINGPRGTGKSMLLQVLTKQTRRTQRAVAFADLAGSDERELLWQLAAGLQAAPSVSASRFEHWRSITEQIQSRQVSGTQTVVVLDHIDRVHADCVVLLERLLQLAARSAGGLTILTAAPTTSSSGYLSLFQQMSDLRIELEPLNAEETALFVHSLLQKAGCHRHIFEADALETLHQRTNGLPRDLVRLCDLALLAGMNCGCDSIDHHIIETAAGELWPGLAALETLSNPADLIQHFAS